MPIDESRSASAAKPDTSSILKRGPEMPWEITSVMGRTLAAVNEGSTEGTAARSVEISALNVPGVLTITYSHMKGVCTKGV
jgi:hypothetical protein